MILCIDTNFIVRWLAVSESDSDDRYRIEYLLERVAKSNGKIIIPMPCFAEFLVHIDDSAMEWVSALQKKRSIVIAPFDIRSAFECSLMDKAALGTGNKRGGRPVSDPWQKIKIDRQVIAIARTHNADTIVSGDSGLRKTAIGRGINALTIEELEIPTYARQQKLALVTANEIK